MERVASGAREGDWQCPNSNCANHLRFVFGSKVACPLCGAPKPEATAATLKAASAFVLQTKRNTTLVERNIDSNYT